MSRSVVAIACQVLQNALEGLLREDSIENVTFEDCDLHRAPHRGTDTLQGRITDIELLSLVCLAAGCAAMG